MWCGVQLCVLRLVWVYIDCRSVSGALVSCEYLNLCTSMACSSVGVEIVDVKGFELLHKGCCVCSGWNVAYQPNEFLL